MMPFNILGIWFRSLFAVAIVVGGVYCLKRGYERSFRVEPDPTFQGELTTNAPPSSPAAAAYPPPTRRVFRLLPEWNEANRYLIGGILLLLWAGLGRLILAAFLKVSAKSTKLTAKQRTAEPNSDPKPQRNGEVHYLPRPDGTQLRVECYGTKLGPTILWCHGWGLDSAEWFYQKENLAQKFRLVVWDERGLGLSKKPANNDFTLEAFARDLNAVVEFCGEDQLFLAGHSIGGMTILTFCKIFPEILRSKISGLILAHTTYTNPVRTTKMAKLYTALEKPVLVPFLYLTIFTWPLVWVMSWMSYLNGSSHRSTHKSSFAGTETLGQLDYVARTQACGRPDTLARGMLGMLKYDATATLAKIGVPTLVIVGDKDETTLPAAGYFIASRVPAARLETLTPAKHQGLLEHHGWFDTVVTDFVSEVSQAM